MLINFPEIQEVLTPHMRGGEKEIAVKSVVTGDNKIMHVRVLPGASIGLHTHEDDSETVFFLSGQGKMIYDGVVEKVHAGQCHHCPKGHSHTLVNDSDEDLVAFAVIPKQ